MIKNIWNLFKDQKNSYKVFLVLFALLFTKSIFISPFSLFKGIGGILLGFLLWICVFIVILCAIYFLKKINWLFAPKKVKKTNILLYMIPSLAVSIFLLLAVFPGIMSWDSMYIWESVMTGNYSSLHPIAYVMFVRLLYLIVSSPWLVIAVQFTYSAFIFSYIAYTLESFGLNKKLCWAVVLILSFYPVNAITNVTMLKDVPYIMSLVLLSILFLRIVVKNELSILSVISIVVVSLIAMFSRHNGLLSVPLILLFSLIYFIVKRKKLFAVKALIILTAVLALFFGTNRIIISSLGQNYWDRSTTADILMLPTAQLCYTIDKNYSSLTDEERELSYKYIDVDYIFYQKESIANWQFNNRYLESLNIDVINADKEGFIQYYFDMLKSYPLDMIKEYEQLTGIVWATPNYGYTLLKNVGLPDRYVDIGLKTDYKFPEIAKVLSQNPKVLFWLRPAMWLMLSLLLVFVSDRKNRLNSIFIISPMLANAFVYLLGTPAQNVRYFYCNFTCFIILAFYTFMTKTSIKNKKDEPVK